MPPSPKAGGILLSVASCAEFAGPAPSSAGVQRSCAAISNGLMSPAQGRFRASLTLRLSSVRSRTDVTSRRRDEPALVQTGALRTEKGDIPALLRKAGLPQFRVYDLRHSAATLLLSEGVPVKVVSEMLGHTDVTTTSRICVHVLEGAQEQAAGVMDRLFGG